MKGYLTHGAYMGWIGYKYIQFETEEDYVAWYRDQEGE